jgi:vacuolar protein-sorting-associated protein 4
VSEIIEQVLQMCRLQSKAKPLTVPAAMDAEHERRKSAIEATIMSPDGLGFDAVIGLKDAKASLREAVVLPTLLPNLFSGARGPLPHLVSWPLPLMFTFGLCMAGQGPRKPWRRILLYGPPGTGKTQLARACASEISGPFYCVSSADLISSWVGESEKYVQYPSSCGRGRRGVRVGGG